MTKVTYYGHSCFLFELGKKRVLVDPFITGNSQAKNINVSSIKPDVVFLTHGHGDHVADVETVCSKDTPVVSNFEVANWFGGKGLNAQGMNQGGIWDDSFGTVRLVTAIHSSSLPDGSYGGNPCGLVFTTDSSTFYLAGDTSLTKDMELIPLLCGKVDFAILPVGGHFTMGASEAVWAAKFVGTKKVIGCHFDTFPPITIDHDATRAIFNKENIELKLPTIGETFEW